MQPGDDGATVSRISQSYPDRVEVRGRELTGDLDGPGDVHEYFHLLLTGAELGRPLSMPIAAVMAARAEGAVEYGGGTTC